MCSDVRQLTLTQRTCPPNVVVQRIRSAVLSTIIPVLSTIILISSAVKYPWSAILLITSAINSFIFLGTATSNMTIFYSLFFFFCSLTSFVLASDFLFRDRFLVCVAYSLVVLQTFLAHDSLFFRGIHLLATDYQFAGFVSGLPYMCRGSAAAD